jgi:hypothetical protein
VSPLLGNADASAAVRHQPMICRARQDAAPGDRMAVDRGDDGLQDREQRLERAIHRRQKRADVRRTFGCDTNEVYAGGEKPGGAGDHERFG